MGDLKIKIIGTLDKDLSKTEINAKILELQSKIEPLKLAIQIDDATKKSLSDFSKAMENHTKIAKDLNSVMREEKTIIKESDTVTREKIKQTLKSGEIIEKEIVKIKNKNKETEKEIEVTGKLISELDALGKKQKEITLQNGNGEITGSSQKFRDKFTDVTYNANKNGELTSVRTVENLDQQRKAIEQLNQQLLKLQKTGEVSDKTIQRLNMAINTAQDVEQIDKLRNRINTLNNAVTNRQVTKELQNQLDLYKRQAQIQATALKNNNHKMLTTDQKAALQDYLNNVNSLNRNTPQLQQRMRQLSLDYREISTQAQTASHHTQTFGNMLQQAFTKFPIWMIASTAFFGSFRALTGTLQIITDVDSRLTSLKKVMDSDTNFAEIMDNATLSAQRFGKTLNEVLDAYNEFARQGYKQQDLVNLGDAGLITSNVGEMTSGRAAEYLTSALVQMNMETKDSMKIIDAWNNVSNKNATTVERLAAGMSKAGSTAHAFGLDMNQLNAIVGTVTAATKQSGDVVGNFVKSVLPRLLGKPAQNALKSLNIDFLDKKTGDMRNAVDIYGEVAEKVQNISKVEKAAVMEGLAGKLHISRMTALIDNWDMYNKMLKESANSEGSAERENDKYMKSITAKIAIMKQSFEQLALILGKSFLTEGFIQSLKGMESVAQGMGNLVKNVGGLPLILGTVTIASTLLSKTFRGLLTEGGLLNGMFVKMGISAKGLGFALRGAIASTGIGLAIIGISYGIEALLGRMGKAREKAEEFDRKNRELTESYKENRKEIQKLTDEYGKLDVKIRNGKFDTNDIERYKNVSNELAKLMPDLANGEDQFGNKIIGSNESIKARIALLEKQTVAQEKLDAIKKKQEIEDNYNTSKDNLNDLENQKGNFLNGKTKAGLNDLKDFQREYDSLQERMAKQGKLSYGEKDTFDYVKRVLNEYDSLTSEIESAKMAHQKATMDMIDNNVKLDSSTSETTKSMINDFTTFVATSESSSGKVNKVLDSVLNKVQNDKGFQKTLEGYSSAFQKYQESINNGTDPKKIEEYKQKAISAFNEVKKVLMSIAKSGKISPQDLNVISGQMDGMANSALISSIDFDKLTKSTGKSKEELMANLLLAPQMEDMYTEMGDDAGDAADNVDELTKALDEANKQYDSSVSKIKDLSTILDDLNKGHGLSADSISTLASKYPELLGYIGDESGLRQQLTGLIDNEKNIAIDAMNAKLQSSTQYFSQLVGANQTYFNNLASFYNIDLKNTTTLAQLKYQVETKLMEKLGDEWANYYDAQSMSFTAAGKAMLSTMGYQEAINSPQLAAIGAYESRMRSLSVTMRNFTAGSGFSAGIGTIGKMGSSSSGSGSNSDSGSSASDKKTPEEVTQEKIDATIKKYEDSLASLDESIKQSEAIQSQYKEGTVEWNAEAQKQITLITQKQTVNKQEISALQTLLNTEKLSAEQKSDLNARIKELTTTQYDYLNSISDMYKKMRDAETNQKVDAITKLYDEEIKKEQEKLGLLEEQEKVQDRLIELKQIQDQLDKAKSDTRFQYINKDGQIELTYDKGLVSDLEKQLSDKNAEYAKEDAKQSINDQIANLEKTRDSSVDQLKQLNEDYMYKAFKNTTDLQNIMNQFVTDLAKIYNTASVIPTITLPQHHEGGIVGTVSTNNRLSDIVNKLFNVKPGEQVIKALKGELMIPQQNIPNFFANMQAMFAGFSNKNILSSPIIKNYHFNNLTIKADNPQEFLAGIDTLLRSE